MSRYTDPGQAPLVEVDGLFVAHPELAGFVRKILADAGDTTTRLILADFVEEKQADFPNAQDLAPIIRGDGWWRVVWDGNESRRKLLWVAYRCNILLAELPAEVCPACVDCGGSPKFDVPDDPAETNLKHVHSLEWRASRRAVVAYAIQEGGETAAGWRCFQACWTDQAFPPLELELPGGAE